MYEKNRYKNLELDDQLKTNNELIKQKLEQKGLSEGMKSNLFSDTNTLTTNHGTTKMSFNRKENESLGNLKNNS